MNRFEQQSNPNQEAEISRREFLEKMGKGVLALLALKKFELGMFDGKKEMKEIVAEQAAIREIKELVNEYIEQDTTLSKKEIEKALEKCGFVEKINVQELRVRNPLEQLTERDLSREPVEEYIVAKTLSFNELRKSLEEALNAGELSLDENALNVIQTDFSKTGLIFFAAATYFPEYKSIFINQENPKYKKERIERLICKEAIDEEYQRVRDNIYKLNLSEIEREQRLDALDEWKDQLIEKKFTQIPNLILKYKEQIKESIKKFRIKKAINRVYTESVLPHEAFHHFCDTMLTKDGYQGPNIEELLAVAIRGGFKRSKYGYGFGDIRYWLKDSDISISDSAALSKFCKDIVNKYDLTLHPNISKEKLNNLSSTEELENFFKYTSFHRFLHEFWARIYNGACGNTPLAVKLKLEKALKKELNIVLEVRIDSLESAFHKPTDEELELLKQMKWKGAPILKTKE